MAFVLESDPMTTTIFRTSPILAISPGAIAILKAQALADPKGRTRICLHADHAAPVQEMVIALTAGQTVTAHRQPAIDRKTYCMIDGVLDFVFFDDDGVIQERFRLAASGEHARVITFPAGRWHGCAAVSDVAIYLETIAGPYQPGGTEWREWKPTP